MSRRTRTDGTAAPRPLAPRLGTRHSDSGRLFPLSQTGIYMDTASRGEFHQLTDRAFHLSA